MPPKVAKIVFNWVVNTNRPAPLSDTTVRNYKTSLNKIATKEYIDDEGKVFHIDTVEKLLKYPEEVIKEVNTLSQQQKYQAFSAIMYEVGIGKTKDETFAKLTRQNLKYYNAFQEIKLDKEGNPIKQKTFDSYEEYLESYKSYSE
jgi:hypothetical protein